MTRAPVTSARAIYGAGGARRDLRGGLPHMNLQSYLTRRRFPAPIVKREIGRRESGSPGRFLACPGRSRAGSSPVQAGLLCSGRSGSTRSALPVSLVRRIRNL